MVGPSGGPNKRLTVAAAIRNGKVTATGDTLLVIESPPPVAPGGSTAMSRPQPPGTSAATQPRPPASRGLSLATKRTSDDGQAYSARPTPERALVTVRRNTVSADFLAQHIPTPGGLGLSAASVTWPGVGDGADSTGAPTPPRAAATPPKNVPQSVHQRRKSSGADLGVTWGEDDEYDANNSGGGGPRPPVTAAPPPGDLFRRPSRASAAVNGLPRPPPFATAAGAGLPAGGAAAALAAVRPSTARGATLPLATPAVSQRPLSSRMPYGRLGSSTGVDAGGAGAPGGIMWAGFSRSDGVADGQRRPVLRGGAAVGAASPMASPNQFKRTNSMGAPVGGEGSLPPARAAAQALLASTAAGTGGSEAAVAAMRLERQFLYGSEPVPRSGEAVVGRIDNLALMRRKPAPTKEKHAEGGVVPSAESSSKVRCEASALTDDLTHFPQRFRHPCAVAAADAYHFL